jgi:hypothetical protein
MTWLSAIFQIRCRSCGKRPNEIAYYRRGAEAVHDAATADEFVKHDEPTFNRFTRRFTCVECRASGIERQTGLRVDPDWLKGGKS